MCDENYLDLTRYLRYSPHKRMQVTQVQFSLLVHRVYERTLMEDSNLATLFRKMNFDSRVSKRRKLEFLEYIPSSDIKLSRSIICSGMNVAAYLSRINIVAATVASRERRTASCRDIP